MNPRLRKILLCGSLGLVAAAVLLIAALAVLDWDWLRGPIARVVSARSGRTVTIAGHLRAQLWSRTPTVTVEDLRVANPPWEVPRPLLQLKRLQVQLDLGSVLRGHLVLARVVIDQSDLYLHQESSGRANWTDSNTAPTSAAARASRPFNLPPIHELIINAGRLMLLDDPHRLKINGSIQAHEHSALADPQALLIEGRGTVNDAPFALDLSGGALLVVDSTHPYPFKLSIQAGQNQVQAAGEVVKPFDLGQIRLGVCAHGPDLAQLYYLTHLALPNSPPYQLQAQISRDGQRFIARNIKGSLGRSDISGSVDVDASHQRPKLTANLNSGHLFLSDLGALMGTRASPAGTPTQASQGGSSHASAAAPPAQPGKLFPDAHLETNRVRAMDADLSFKATDIESGKVPFTQVNLHATLKDGILTLDPVRFDMPQGHLSGAISIDARPKVPTVHMELHATDIKLDQIKGAGPASAAPIEGVLQARAVISGQGDSVHSVMSDADGSLVAVIPHGDIRAAFAELTGIDLKGVGQLLSKSEDRAPIRCGVAHFAIRDGTATAQSFILDTQNVLITGKGKIDLGTERLDLTIQGQPKKFHLVRVRAPVQIKGPLIKPRFGPDKAQLVKQGAVAAALGTVLTPVAAMLAFVDPGLAKDQDCSQLLAKPPSDYATVR